MQTHFRLEQLLDPEIAEANGILRSCVHCGFCTATCPTYVLLGDERDSPRGRIYLIKSMLEEDVPATADVVKHIDRCLSCLSCMTTCPSGVHYMHLIDQARVRVEETYVRPLPERVLRKLLASTLPSPFLMRWLLRAAQLAQPLQGVMKSMGFNRLTAALALAPGKLPAAEALGRPGLYADERAKRGRVGLLQGCVQSVTDPAINAATIRLLTRLGFDVVVPKGEPCCGSLPHHMGLRDDALSKARANIGQWEKADVEHIIITASGCGTTIQDYGHMLRLEPAYAERAAAISAKARDVTEFLATLELPPKAMQLRVTYHSACSLQHGQKITGTAQALLLHAGFTVSDVPEGHLCCGSAGTYNILQPEIASQLKARKLTNIMTTHPHAVAAGNIGCITQLASGAGVPVLHTVELLDWAYGGPKPRKLEQSDGETTDGKAAPGHQADREDTARLQARSDA
jgi:glycolate oxidase iron-sulfur subunit